MQYDTISNTDLRVSRIALGCWQFSSDLTWNDQEDRDSLNTVAAAIDHGITFFDNAEAYGDGRAEAVLGEALRGRRNEVVVATKTTGDDPGRVVSACEASLRRLRTDHIDLYQIHWPSPEYPPEAFMDELETLVQAGKVRHAGVCNYGPADLDAAEAADTLRPVSNQVPYSLLFRAIEFDVMPAVRRHGMSVLAYSVLLHGLLTGKFSSADDVPEGRARSRHFSDARPHARHGEPGAEQETFDAIREIDRVARNLGVPMHHLATAWVLAQPRVTSAILGARTPDQIKDNAAAAALHLDREMISELREITDRLKEKLGPNPDLWQSESRYS